MPFRAISLECSLCKIRESPCFVLVILVVGRLANIGKRSNLTVVDVFAYYHAIPTLLINKAPLTRCTYTVLALTNDTELDSGLSADVIVVRQSHSFCCILDVSVPMVISFMYAARSIDLQIAEFGTVQ